MKHVTMADKSLLMGDTVADLLAQYAALMAKVSSGDIVTINAFGDDGDPVEVTFVLNPGTVLLVETSHGHQEEPDNAEAESYIRDRLERFEFPPVAGGLDSVSGAPDLDWEP
jgi:hypothetical protein